MIFLYKASALGNWSAKTVEKELFQCPFQRKCSTLPSATFMQMGNMYNSFWMLLFCNSFIHLSSWDLQSSHMLNQFGAFPVKQKINLGCERVFFFQNCCCWSEQRLAVSKYIYSSTVLIVLKYILNSSFKTFYNCHILSGNIALLIFTTFNIIDICVKFFSMMIWCNKSVC